MVLHEATCTDISFRPVDKQLVVTFADAIAGEADAVLAFDDGCIYRWRDEGDGPEGLPADWPIDVLGQTDIIEMDGDVLPSTLNVVVNFVAARVSYRIVEHRA